MSIASAVETVQNRTDSHRFGRPCTLSNDFLGSILCPLSTRWLRMELLIVPVFLILSHFGWFSLRQMPNRAAHVSCTKCAWIKITENNGLLSSVNTGVFQKLKKNRFVIRMVSMNSYLVTVHWRQNSISFWKTCCTLSFLRFDNPIVSFGHHGPFYLFWKSKFRLHQFQVPFVISLFYMTSDHHSSGSATVKCQIWSDHWLHSAEGHRCPPSKWRACTVGSERPP